MDVRSLVVACLSLFAASAHAQNLERLKLKNFEFPHTDNSLILFPTKSMSLSEWKALLTEQGGTFRNKFSSSDAVVADFPRATKKTLGNLAASLAARPELRRIEANTIIKADAMPNDPEFGKLYGMHNTGDKGGIADADIDAPEAWDVTKGSHKVLVAIVDTGINYGHPDLQGNIWTNPGESGLDANGKDKRSNGIDDDGNGYIDDYRGWDFAANDNDPKDDNGYAHGTHCAGTIGALGDNGIGVVGVAWHVSLVGVKFLTAAGTGELAHAISAIEYANNIGADISSNSWGGGGYSEAMFQAIKAGVEKDVLFVAAAGNASTNTDDSPHYPSSYDVENIIAVAASDRKDTIALFSNHGLKTVDIAAPGVDILSLSRNDELQTLSGTSMATPHVSGAAALIKSYYPQADFRELMKRLRNGADRVTLLSPFVGTGARLNVANALEDDRIAPSTVDSANILAMEKQSIALTWNPAGDDGDAGLAAQYEIRISDKEIANEDDWNAALRPDVTFAEDRENPGAVLSNLRFNYKGFLSIRALDNVGNRAALGRNIPFQVKSVNQIFSHLANDLNGVTATAPWNIETLADVGRTAFSDSPGGQYTDDLNISLTFAEITLPPNAQGLALSFATRTDLEKGYDFGIVEVSTDNGSSWQEITRITGNKAWHSRLIDLKAVSGKSKMLLRFRLLTDYVILGDGWFIDDVVIVSDT